MKILVATKKTQGQRKNDFNFVKEGEIVYFGSRCTTGHVDDDCGCRRCLIGIASSRGTTTAMVVESDHDRRTWCDLVGLVLLGLGWIGPRGMAAEAFTWMEARVGSFPVGTIVEIRDDVLVARKE